MVVVPIKLLIVQRLLRNEVDMMPLVVITYVMVAVSCLAGSIEGRNHRSSNNNIGLVRGDGYATFSNLGGGLPSDVSSLFFDVCHRSKADVPLIIVIAYVGIWRRFECVVV